MAARIDIEYKAATDEAAADIDRVNAAVGRTGKESDGVKTQIKGLQSDLNLLSQGYHLAEQAVKLAIDPTIEYAGQVRELGRTIGSTAEEGSKLIQAADDVGISADTLSSALQAAIRKGVKPTISGIGDLADEYNGIQDPIARTKFLMDNFGRSGAALAPLMEEGAVGIKAAGDAAERTGLVMSEKGVQGAREYEIAVDNLQDSFQAFQLTLGQAVIPEVTEYMQTLAALDEAQKRGLITTGEAQVEWLRMGLNLTEMSDITGTLTGMFEKQDRQLAAETGRYQGYADALKVAASDTNTVANATRNAAGWLDDLAGATSDATKAEQALALSQKAAAAAQLEQNAATAVAAGMSGTLEQAQDDYRAVLDDTTAQIADLTTEIQHYQDTQGQTYTVTTEATASLDEYNLAQLKAADAAVKLSEYTGDNQEEYLSLKIAAADAAEKVGNLGTQMGMTTSYTVDHTAALAADKEELAKQIATQAEAEEQLKKTTAQFIYQQIASQLDASTQLEVARSLGLLNEESYNTAQAVLELTEKYDTNGKAGIQADEATTQYLADLAGLHAQAVITAEGHDQTLTPAVEKTGSALATAAEEAQGYGADLDKLNGKTVNTYLNTYDTVYHNDAYTDAYRNATGSGRASGGPVSGGSAYMVGEQGPEMFFPNSSGNVINNDVVTRLAKAIEALAGGGGATNNYYGYGGGSDDSGQARALAGALQ